MEFTDVPGPAHPHDCEGPGGCVYLGSIAAVEGLAPAGVTMDLWVHPPSTDPRQANGSLIHRTGPDGEYGSMPLETHRSLDPDPAGSPSLALYAEIYRRAQAAGCLTPGA